MTDTVVIDASEQVPLPAASGERRARRRRLGLWLSIAGVAALVILGWGVWNAVASSALDGVSLTYDTRPIVCDGATVETRESVENPDFSQPSVVLAEGMQCQLRLQVVNDGGAEVNLESVTLQGLAPDNVLQLDVQFVNPNAQHGEAEEFDYRFPMPGGLPIAPGSIETVVAVIDYDGGAVLSPCSAQGWRIPEITVTAFGQSRTLASPPHSDIWFSNGSVEECGG